MYDCLRIKINAEDSKIVPYGGDTVTPGVVVRVHPFLCNDF